MQNQILGGLLIFSILGTLYHFDNDTELPFQKKNDSLYKHFESWKQKFNIEIQDYDTNLYRYNIFKDNYHFIQETNAQKENDIVELNHLAHISHQEYKDIFLSKSNNNNNNNSVTNQKIISEYKPTNPSKTEDPSSINWIEKGQVIPSMDLGRCSASYAFATASAATSLQAQLSGNLIPLSTQTLISCDINQDGCEGGDALNSIIYSIKFGLETESYYPYTSYDGKVAQCQSVISVQKFQPNDGYVIKENAPEVVQSVVAQQPVIAFMNASDRAFQLYKGDSIYQGSEECGWDDPNYFVAIVGYNNDQDSDSPYWIIQSSFGPHWGNNGFMKIKKDPKGKGVCRMYYQVSFPAYDEKESQQQ